MALGSMRDWLRGRWRRYRRLGQALYWTVTVTGIIWVVAVFLGFLPVGVCDGLFIIPCDAYSYWAVDETPYVWESGYPFRYSPAFLWASAPLRALPWELFLAIWVGAHIAALLWLRAGWLLVIPGPNDDIIRGNISIFLAVAVVLAIQRSSVWWAPILLTKVAPGVGMVWHVARGEWRALALGVGVTAGIVGIGWIIDPALWTDWIGTLTVAESTYEIGHLLGPLPVRLAISAAVIAFGARTDRAWLVPVAMLVAVPGLWPYQWALLTAIPRLLEKRGQRETATRRPLARDPASERTPSVSSAAKPRVARGADSATGQL